MNLKPAFQYQFKSFLKGTATIFLALSLIILVFGLLFGMISIDTTSSGSFSGYGMAVTIFLFVMGIVNLRSDLRLCVQFGVSRRTSFISELLAVLSITVILAVAGELLTGIAQMLLVGNSKFYVTDLYQLVYLSPDQMLLTYGQHIMSALVNASLMLAASLLGMFFTLLFWRLNKFWTIIAAISIPVSMNIIPFLLSKSGANFEPFFRWMKASPYCFALFFLLLAVLLGVVDWLLLRKAKIKPASGK